MYASSQKPGKGPYVPSWERQKMNEWIPALLGNIGEDNENHHRISDL
jgi:hypothetical protein